MSKESIARLKEVISITGKGSIVANGPDAFKIICWELMKAHTAIKKVSDSMDKKIKKIEREMKSLEKADKKRDKVCEMGKKVMKKKGSRGR